MIKLNFAPAKTSCAGYLDWAGAATSGVCALHCAALPAVSAALPMFGDGVLMGERAEMALIAASAVIGSISLSLGFCRHGSRRALALLGAGMGLLALGRYAEGRDAERFGVFAVVSGGLVVAGSHLLNRRLCRSCEACRRCGESSLDDAPDSRPGPVNVLGKPGEFP